MKSRKNYFTSCSIYQKLIVQIEWSVFYGPIYNWAAGKHPLGVKCGYKKQIKLLLLILLLPLLLVRIKVRFVIIKITVIHWSEIHQSLLLQFSPLVDFFTVKLPVKN